MKILIIDDEDDIRRVARLSLVKIGELEVVEAASGPDGLRVALAERPDAILLDVMMPAMDGPETLSALRADPATASIPVVFLTAKAMGSELERLRSLGAVGVLTKPFDPLTLPAELKQTLRQGFASEMAAMRDEYAAVLPAKLEELSRIVGLAREAPDELERTREVRALAHALRGTAGSFGFHGVSEAAGHIEDGASRRLREPETSPAQAFVEIDRALAAARASLERQE